MPDRTHRLLEKLRNVHTAIAIRDDPGDGSPATAAARLAAIRRIDPKGCNGGLRKAAGVSGGLKAGYVIMLPAAGQAVEPELRLRGPARALSAWGCCALANVVSRVSSRFMNDVFEPKLLNIRQAAHVLNASARFVEQRVKTGELPSVKLGKLRRIHRDVLEEFSRFGIIPGEKRGWRQDRAEDVDG
jgi:excisionase family DNA binding protein